MLDDLSKIIKYHRKKSGLSQLELADLAGVGKTVIFDIEHNKTTIKMDTLFKVLKILNIKIKLLSPLMENYLKENNEKS
ncbi:MAG: helix-turn-helix domain-containing protein [Cyanobacteriota bacterium]